MEGQEGTQQPHLVLAHKRFLLTHPDVQDIEKVRLKEEVFAAVKADGNLPIHPTQLSKSSVESDLVRIFFSFLSSRYGSLVRNPGERRVTGEGSELFGFDAHEEWRGAQEARGEVSFFLCFQFIIVLIWTGFLLFGWLGLKNVQHKVITWHAVFIF